MAENGWKWLKTGENFRNLLKVALKKPLKPMRGLGSDQVTGVGQ